MTTITLSKQTAQKFNIVDLERFINSEEFEEMIFGYQMMQGKTGQTQDFNSFKKELGL